MITGKKNTHKKKHRKLSSLLLRFLWQVVCWVIVVILGFVGVAVWMGVEEAYCRHTDMDLNSGDLRHQRYVAFVTIDGTVTRTPYSQLVHKYVGSQTPADWVRVHTEQPTGGGDTCKFSRATSLCDDFAAFVSHLSLPEDRLRELVATHTGYLRRRDLDGLSVWLGSFYEECKRDLEAGKILLAEETDTQDR